MGFSHPCLQSLNNLAVRPLCRRLSRNVHSILVREEWKDRFSLTPEDYLHGVITAINELVRMPYSLRFAEVCMNQIRSLVWL